MPRPNCLFSWITQPSEVISNYETSGRLEWRRTNIQSWSCGTVWGTARLPRSPCSCMSAHVLWKKWTAEEQQSPWLLAVVWPSSAVTALWGGSQHVEDIFLSPLYYCSFQINKERERDAKKKCTVSLRSSVYISIFQVRNTFPASHGGPHTWNR